MGMIKSKELLKQVKKGKRKKLNKIREMRIQGKTFREIAYKLDMSEETIRNFLANNDVEYMRMRITQCYKKIADYEKKIAIEAKKWE